MTGCIGSNWQFIAEYFGTDSKNVTRDWPGVVGFGLSWEDIQELWESTYPELPNVVAASCNFNYTGEFEFIKSSVGNSIIIGNVTYKNTGLTFGNSFWGTCKKPPKLCNDTEWVSFSFRCNGKRLCRWRLAKINLNDWTADPDPDPDGGGGGGGGGGGECGGDCGECVDMNPAHIIRECLTDPEWGMGYSDEDIDDDSFRAAADILCEEKFGLSILWQRENTIEEFVKDIARHIDAAVYVDRRTGKFKIKLLRDDYDPASLITLSPDNIERIDNYKRPAFGDLVNTLTVIYDDCNDGRTEIFEAGGGNEGVGGGTPGALDCIQWDLFETDNSGEGNPDLNGFPRPAESCLRAITDAARGVYAQDVSTADVRADMLERLQDKVGCEWTSWSTDGDPRDAVILSIEPHNNVPWVTVTWNWKSPGFEQPQTIIYAVSGIDEFQRPQRVECP